MRHIVIGFLIVCLYCFPFVYFSMYQDFSNHTMLGYLIAVVVTSILALLGKLNSTSKSIIFIIIGNILSLIISFHLISEMSGNERWGSYFKPLSPYQFLIFVSLLNLVPQLLVMKLAGKYKKE
ncbi:hypothetical protein D3C74_59590 [compost metagenome]